MVHFTNFVVISTLNLELSHFSHTNRKNYYRNLFQGTKVTFVRHINDAAPLVVVLVTYVYCSQSNRRFWKLSLSVSNFIFIQNKNVFSVYMKSTFFSSTSSCIRNSEGLKVTYILRKIYSEVERSQTVSFFLYPLYYVHY